MGAQRVGRSRGVVGLVVVIFVPIVLLAVGVGLLVWTGKAQKLAADAPGFSLVSGHLDEVGFLRIGRGPVGRRFRLEARYSYEVNGVRYTSDVVAPTPPEFRTEEAGQEWLVSCNVRQGGPIDVFYDPDSPGRAVLIREPDAEFASKMQGARIGGWVVLGVLAALVGVFGLVPAARRRLLR